MGEGATDAVPRYAEMISGLLASPATLDFATERDSTLQVERGVVLSMRQAGAAEAAITPLMGRGVAKRRVVDAAGHERPAYAGLLFYAWMRAATPAQRKTWHRPIRWWCPALHRIVRKGSGESSDRTAVSGAAWAALGLQAGGWPDAATALLPRLIQRQQMSGAFLAPDASKSPETYWYHELVLLHAVAAYGAHAGAPDVALAADAAASRAANYHLFETQPDHATNEPWGLLAFIRNPETQMLADQLLHTVRVQQPGGPQGVTRILLADVLDCLKRS